MLTMVSGVRYPMTPTLVPLTSKTYEGVRLGRFSMDGTKLVFRLAQTMGTDTLEMYGVRPAIPSSNSWLPRDFEATTILLVL